MDNKEYKSIAVDYKLYVVENGEKSLQEETSAGNPFRFLSGFGMTIPGFENAIAPLAVGDTFDFTLSKDDAYGDYVAERVLDLSKDIFCIDGKFDDEHIYVDAIIPLQNQDGNRFMGHVLEINNDKNTVKIDLNHPLAGKTLNFVGAVVESREATNGEIQAMINHMTGGGGCGGCGGGCNGGCGGCGGDGGCDCENGDCDCKK
jgi:FKBP-type peptidyl-prolyl cis-trans isomerase SlyD